MLKAKIVKASGANIWGYYSFAPNRFGYCGPDSNLNLFEYTVGKNKDDRGLRQILSEFEAAFPYIKFIALENHIRDPFDWRVVEAYWLGNDLLNNISTEKFYRHLEERFKKRANPIVFNQIVKKLPNGVKPHHSFHVLEIFRQLGSSRNINFNPIIETINNCLVGWGRIDKIEDNVLIVNYCPLIFNNKLIYGPEEKKKIDYRIDGKSFIKDPKVGNWVSYHWNWACEILDSRQLKNLQKWTRWHIRLANLTI